MKYNIYVLQYFHPQLTNDLFPSSKDYTLDMVPAAVNESIL